MKRQYRIKKNYEFQTIIKKKQFVNSPSFVVYYRNKQEDISRFGISVGTKMGNAVLRNKIKRQIRMMLQELDNTSYSYDGIIIIRKKYLTQTYLENRKDLERILKKVTI